MSTPVEHKTVQAHILAYAQNAEWTFVSREEAERRRGIAAIKHSSLFFDDLLGADANLKILEYGHSCPPTNDDGELRESGQECPHSFVAASGENSEGGQECPRSPFLDLSQPITQYRHVLPHWEQAGKWIFVTWRLKDSLPTEKLREWREEKTRWLEEHPEPWDEQTGEDYHRTFSDRINYWLDKGSGACVLRAPAIGKRVAEVLLHDDGKKIEMDCFVVMPNHVHALFCLLPGASLEAVIKSWKGISSRRINQQLGQSGTLWQEDYWDRLIRSEKHFHRIRRYIRENPQDAGLKEWYFLWERGHSCPPALG